MSDLTYHVVATHRGALQSDSFPLSIQALQDIEEADLRDIVYSILYDEKYRDSEEVKQITSLFAEGKNEKVAIGKFILRAPTGKQAEDFFIKYFADFKKPISGELLDCRDLGVGYDFEVQSKKQKYFIEVKGLSDFSGGVLFTNKEWATSMYTGGPKGLLPQQPPIKRPMGRGVKKQKKRKKKTGEVS